MLLDYELELMGFARFTPRQKIVLDITLTPAMVNLSGTEGPSWWSHFVPSILLLSTDKSAKNRLEGVRREFDLLDMGMIWGR